MVKEKVRWGLWEDGVAWWTTGWGGMVLEPGITQGYQAPGTPKDGVRRHRHRHQSFTSNWQNGL